jgi:hypothetical protein
MSTVFLYSVFAKNSIMVHLLHLLCDRETSFVDTKCAVEIPSDESERIGSNTVSLIFCFILLIIRAGLIQQIRDTSFNSIE